MLTWSVRPSALSQVVALAPHLLSEPQGAQSSSRSAGGSSSPALSEPLAVIRSAPQATGGVSGNAAMTGTRSTSPLRPMFPIPTWSRGLVQRAGPLPKIVALFAPLLTRPAIEIFRSLRASRRWGSQPSACLQTSAGGAWSCEAVGGREPAGRGRARRVSSAGTALLIQAPAPMTAARPSAIALVWTQVRQALQQVAAIGAWSPSFAAAWLMRPGRNRPHSLILRQAAASRYDRRLYGVPVRFTMQWGRGGSLCGWRPKALFPSALGRLEPAGRVPFLRQTFLAEPRHVAQQHASELGEFVGGSSSAARIVVLSGIVSASTFVPRPYAVSSVGEVWVVDEAGELEDGFLPRGPGDSAEVNVHIVPPDDPVAQLSSDLLERASLVGDAAISFLVSEDSRLVDTVRQCKALGHRCGVGIPSASFHRQFQEHAAFYKRIRKRALMASLLDDPIQSARGPLSKPRSW